MTGSPSPRLCSACGKPVPGNATVCPRDGMLLDDDGTAPTAIRNKPPPSLVPKDPLIGKMLGEYRVEEEIGSGGMGLVYRAVQPVIGRRVAIKVLRAEVSRDPVHVERLLSEARAVAAIHHRAIIDVFNFGTLPDGRQYLVMEYLEGTSLDARLQEKGALPLPQTAAFLRDLASALAGAHGAGVVHRDLKPSNVIIVRQGGVQFVKLLDFGLAEPPAHPSDAAKPGSNLVMGTPEYMAPEQVHGEEITPRTDLYALGVMGFEMLTGRLPFDGPGPIQYMRQHATVPPPDVRTLRPEAPPALAELLAALMQKRPENRPASAEEVRLALRAIATQVGKGPAATGESPSLAEAPPRGSSEAPRAQTPPRTSSREQAAPPPAATERATIKAGTSNGVRALLLASVVIAGAGLAYLASAILDERSEVVAKQELRPPTPLAPEPVVRADPEPPPPPAKEVPEKKRARPKGSITLVTSPEASVKVKGGGVLGKTPLFDVGLESGTHLLELTGPDGKVRVLSAPIEAGKNTRFRLKLADLPLR